MTFEEKIFDLRKKKGWSQEQLAEQLSVSRQAVSKWESGASRPDTEKLILLSRVFEVTMDYLVNNTQDKELDLELTSVPLQNKPYDRRKIFITIFAAGTALIVGMVLFFIFSILFGFPIWLVLYAEILIFIIFIFVSRYFLNGPKRPRKQ